jgi:hypothetical protein
MLRTVLILAQIVLLAVPPRACVCSAACAETRAGTTAAARPASPTDDCHDDGCPLCASRRSDVTRDESAAPGRSPAVPSRHAPSCPCLRQPTARVERAELTRAFWLAGIAAPTPADETAPPPAVAAAPVVVARPAPSIPLFLALCSLRI